MLWREIISFDSSYLSASLFGGGRYYAELSQSVCTIELTTHKLCIKKLNFKE